MTRAEKDGRDRALLAAVLAYEAAGCAGYDRDPPDVAGVDRAGRDLAGLIESYTLHGVHYHGVTYLLEPDGTLRVLEWVPNLDLVPG